ncbi:hypothetical protein RB195_019147 [Necator americanus]|uniref:Uncharacterized protein n=1 Tax=Necator americanus TaxID=51031 RepID=A0ABR1CEM4_NECAM
MSEIPSQQVVSTGIDNANAKMGLEQQSNVLEKWYYPAERASDNGARLVDLCEQTGLIIASTFKSNHRRHQLTWKGSTLLMPEEQRKRKMTTLKLQLDYVLARNIPQISENLELFGTLLSIVTSVQFSALRYGSTRGTEEYPSQKSIWQI